MIVFLLETRFSTRRLSMSQNRQREVLRYFFKAINFHLNKNRDQII